ncbi:STAS domain-containing protein [Persephonella hydrogeniphila]|uniref:STAS domain-containing protein n=1 Tax=Persephonella hydrogeniphila TaxID=198703 RepID=A0A285NJA3_9AQUI|nr:STAS domain-containing protein [Persephonella hydrogeniphila]SNZ09570.1 STAS domain-containing protein [Persephonella hydrogeniphila]
MEYHKRDETIYIKLKSDFIYPTVKKIENLLNVESFENLVIDLSESKIVDSEAVKFLYSALKEGISITLVNPPEIYGKILKILQLDDHMKDIKIVMEGRQ